MTAYQLDHKNQSYTIKHLKMKQLLLICIPLFLFSCSASKEAKNQALVSQQQAEKAEQEMSGMKKQMEGMYEKNAQLQENKTKLEKTNQQLMNENEVLRQKLSMNKSQLEQVTTEMEASSDDYGVWFRVQIGAFESRKINENLQTTDELSLEQQEDMQKISLGRFRDYEEAKSLKKHLQEIGLKDAWVVSYKDGKRVPIESVVNTAE